MDKHFDTQFQNLLCQPRGATLVELLYIATLPSEILKDLFGEKVDSYEWSYC